LSPVYTTIGNKHFAYDLKKTSERTLVVIKGYQDNHGRALNALSSIELLVREQDLSGFKFRVFSASKVVKKKAKEMRKSLNLDIAILDKMPKLDLMQLYKEARVYLGLAISDGLSTSMVEAMNHGVFPIQSINSAAPEFLLNGVTGGVVDPYDIVGVASLLRDALFNDQLVDEAAKVNREVLQIKYDWDIGIRKVKQTYE
jgi:glycosyltransferase involved in cell wall biosynthesis